MAAPNLNEMHDFLVSLAFRAGDIITNALPATSDTGSKKNSRFGGWMGLQGEEAHYSYVGADLVTEYDRAVEYMLSSSLKDKYPDYEYVWPSLPGSHSLVCC